MRKFFILLGVLSLVAFLSRVGMAETTASLAFQAEGRSGQWEVVAVRVQAPTGGGTIYLQDGRGGISVGRSLDAAVTEGTGGAGAAGESRILLPLPLLAKADLPPGKWPLEVSVRAASGKVTQERVDAALGGQKGFRIFTVGGAGSDLAWGKLGSAPAVFAACGQQEIVSGPALLFAGSDAVVIPDGVAQQLPAERIAALLNTGVRLVLPVNPATLGDGAVLGQLAWTHVGAGMAGEFWITPASGYARPRVVEEGLARARTLDVRAPVGRGTLTAVLLIPLGALAVLLLARGLFRRRLSVLVAMLLGLAAVGVGGIALVRSSAGPATRTIAWSNREGASKETSLRVTEKFTASSSLFSQELRTDAEAASMAFPVTASVREYFALPEAVLSLDVLSESGLERVTRLEMAMKPRDCAVTVVRSAVLLAGVPDLEHGNWIDGGYVSAAKAAGQAGTGDGTIVAEWARAHAESQDAILTWYELRFAGDHRYFMREPTADDPLRFVDFGIGAAATLP